MNKKRRWECTAANKEYSAIDNEEMKARLEELWMILLNVKSQQNFRQSTSAVPPKNCEACKMSHTA